MVQTAGNRGMMGLLELGTNRFPQAFPQIL
jgi:hypothetical protein